MTTGLMLLGVLALALAWGSTASVPFHRAAMARTDSHPRSRGAAQTTGSAARVEDSRPASRAPRPCISRTTDAAFRDVEIARVVAIARNDADVAEGDEGSCDARDDALVDFVRWSAELSGRRGPQRGLDPTVPTGLAPNACDLDNDGELTVADAELLARLISTGNERGDLNADGVLDAGDVAAMLRRLRAPQAPGAPGTPRDR